MFGFTFVVWRCFFFTLCSHCSVFVRFLTLFIYLLHSLSVTETVILLHVKYLFYCKRLQRKKRKQIFDFGAMLIVLVLSFRFRFSCSHQNHSFSNHSTLNIILNDSGLILNGSVCERINGNAKSKTDWFSENGVMATGPELSVRMGVCFGRPWRPCISDDQLHSILE